MKKVFTVKEVEKMHAILLRLNPGIPVPLQIYNPDDALRTGCTIGIKNKRQEWIMIFQNYENLSPFRRKLIDKISKKIEYPIYITHASENITRIGWKTE